MSDRSEYLGSRIRMYRKSKGLSLQDFSVKLFKSVSTVSKYETGDIVVNIDTLYEIAAVLDIPVTELLSFPGDRTAQSVMPPMLKSEVRYMYQYSRSDDRITKSKIEEYKSNDENHTVTLFYDVSTFAHPDRCRSMYRGTMKKDGYLYNYQMTNASNQAEHVFMCTLRSINSGSLCFGLLAGLSAKSFLPEVIKVIISEKPLPENIDLKQRLLVDPADIRLLKRNNFFVMTK